MRLSKLQAMDPIAFEKYVGTLFAARGYRVEDTQASADEGIDLIVRQGRRMAVVQCKRYQGSVGQPVVRDLYGVMLHTGAVEAYLVTTGSVTAAARRWAEGKPIHLVDQHRLVEWARTGRLNYEKPNALKPLNRQHQFFVGLILLAIVAVALVAPEQIVAVRDGVVQAVQPLLARIEASTPPTATPPTATPGPAPVTRAPVLMDADATATPQPSPGPATPGGPPESAPATATPNAGRVPTRVLTPAVIDPIFTATPTPGLLMATPVSNNE
ncbi:MAG: restriction endonuclease [Caldilineaceae bacterium]